MTQNMQTSSQPKQRRELDVMGALVVLGLTPFHAAQIFSIVDFHVKNQPPSDLVMPLLAFVGLWAMPLMFLFAGASIWYSLRKRTAGEFVRERVRRLVVPLVTGVLVLIPIQVYYQLKADPTYQESYAQFLRRFLDVRFTLDFPMFITGASPHNLFTPGHLWFLEYLFLFTMLLLPFFLYVRGPSGRKLVDRLASLCARRWAILVLAIPVGLVEAALMTEYAGFWNRYAYVPFIVYGFLFAADARFGQALQRHRKSALALAVLAFAFWMAGFMMLIEVGRVDPRIDYGPWSLLLRFLKGLTGWLWIVAILGWAGRSSQRGARQNQPRPAAVPASDGSSQALGYQPAFRERVALYLSKAQLPIYVLHLTPIVVIGFYVVQWQASALVKYLVITLASLVGTLVLYDVGVRRTRWTRFLFGMRARQD